MKAISKWTKGNFSHPLEKQIKPDLTVINYGIAPYRCVLGSCDLFID